jgi:hypothetical protein
MAAAAALLAAVAVWQVSVRPAALTAWQVAGIEGAARLGGQNAAVSMALRSGQVLHTGASSEVTLQADSFGQIDLRADSELRAATDRRLVLDHGQLHAFIWSRPGEFQVDTPSSRAIDLGCEYTVTVNGSGDGLLRVAKGWVAFTFHGRESFIPAGAACATRKHEGPGIPYFEDAPEELKRGIAQFDQSGAGLDAILSAARDRDGLTLWHLLTRVAPADRARVYDRFAQLVEVPSDVSREGVLRLDARMVDRCWDALVLENTEWWRGWERKW